jgi:preprotein translocase subunit SecG
MFIALIVLHTALCMAIIGIVLLQSGKGADIGSAFGGAGSQAVFGSMGTPTVLGKITGAVAVLFLATSFGLALLGSVPATSVIREGPAPAAPQAPASPTPAPPAAPPASSAPTPAAPAK